MPGCVAVGCNNRSEKGYIMKCFPRDPNLRRIWQERVARADWKPNNNSFLCHVHFEPQEWAITQTGRIRLKRNAVPSIFTVTSTRKSSKKRTSLANVKNERETEDNMLNITRLKNDTSIGHIEEKDSDSQDIDDVSIQSSEQRVGCSPKMENMRYKSISHKQYGDIGNSNQQEGTILISDDDMEVDNIIKRSDAQEQTNIEKRQLITDFIAKHNGANNQDEDVIKTGIKQEMDQTSLDDSYDDLEEKLKQICDGYREEDDCNHAEKLNSVFINQEETPKELVAQVPFHKSIHYKYSTKNEMGNMLINDTENVEIIFGAESGEEYSHVSKPISYDKNVSNEIDKLSQITDIDHVGNHKEIDKIFPRDVEEPFNKENVHLTPNMRAAMKRKRRTREEIMKSIKKSIRNTSVRDINFLSNSDISDNVMEMKNDISTGLSMPEDLRFNRDDSGPAMTKFTVKVTGDANDVFDIMQDLFKNTRNFKIQGCNNTCTLSGCTHPENNAFVTSVITIEEHSVKANAKDEYKESVPLTNIKNIMSEINDRTLSHYSASKNNKCLNTRLMQHSDEEVDDISSSCLLTDIDSVIKPPKEENHNIKYEYQTLRQKVRMQEDVIRRLTDQLILYKGLEKDLQSKSLALEVKTKEVEDLVYEFNARTGNTSSLTNYKKNVNSKQKLIEDLSNRINYFEEMNKNLMKNITAESQQKRKLEGQIKQRDNQIKELNWKLEKASKFLERAEKNTNTYRRKMLNMQTVMRRKKLLDEKMSRFHEMLIDSVKEGYSEKALAMAVEIRKTCSRSGYDKLLSFGFPLPPLPALQTRLSGDFLDSNESSSKILHTASSQHDVKKKYDTQCSKNGIEVDKKDSEIPEPVTGEIVLSGTETITGTVQDIFDENNDADDFSTNELREHFILELNAVM